MDPLSIAGIAGTAVTLLAPYLPKLIGSAIEEVGKSVPDAAKKLWKLVSGKFRGNAVAEEALKDVAGDPKDEDNIASLRKEIRKALQSDNDFANAIVTILKEIEPGDQIIQTQVIIGTKARDITQIGKQSK